MASKRLRWLCVALACGGAIAVAVGTMRHRGDWAEYVAMARAMIAHRTTDVREADLAWVSDSTGLSRRRFKLGLPGFPQAPNGLFYSIHFWFYSLLAAPFLALTTLAGQSPLVAFALLNAVSLSLAAIYAARGQRPFAILVTMLTLFACGGSFYLGWLGPEVLTAACVLVSCLAAARGSIELGTVAAGVAATQNPSAIVLLPYVGLWWLRHRLSAARALQATSRPRAIPLLIGVALPFLPYLFFYVKFGVFSLIGIASTDVRLFGFARFFSFLFDLNQGLVVGLAGVLVGAALLVALLFWEANPDGRKALALTTLLSVGCFVGLSLPTLIQKNWNADGVAMIRYGYWAAMPFLALFLELWPRVTARLRWVAAAGLVAGQSLAFVVNGPFGQRYSYVRHNALARWVMQHAPGAYNPITEIFWERTMHDESEPSIDAVLEWPGPGFGRKLLTHWSHPLTCKWYGRPGEFLTGASKASAEHGFEYFDAPFSCGTTPAVTRIAWRLSANITGLVFAGGWSTLEADGIWTDGHASTLRLQVPGSFRPHLLRMHGYYLAASTRSSAVTINGEPMGDFDLSEAKLPIMSAQQDSVEVTIVHSDVHVPEVQGFSKDPRQLAYFLQAIALE
jgi:hypothetical protein